MSIVSVVGYNTLKGLGNSIVSSGCARSGGKNLLQPRLLFPFSQRITISSGMLGRLISVYDTIVRESLLGFLVYRFYVYSLLTVYCRPVYSLPSNERLFSVSHRSFAPVKMTDSTQPLRYVDVSVDPRREDCSY